MTCCRCKEGGNNKVYFGETGRNLDTRAKKHKASTNRGDSMSALSEHLVRAHQGDDKVVRWDVEVVATFSGDPMKRQLTEAVAINRTPEDKILNRKDEWGHYNPRKVQVVD